MTVWYYYRRYATNCAEQFNNAGEAMQAASMDIVLALAEPVAITDEDGAPILYARSIHHAHNRLMQHRLAYPTYPTNRPPEYRAFAAQTFDVDTGDPSQRNVDDERWLVMPS